MSEKKDKPGTLWCRACGREMNDDESKFCRGCGHPMADAWRSNPQDFNNSSAGMQEGASEAGGGMMMSTTGEMHEGTHGAGLQGGGSAPLMATTPRGSAFPDLGAMPSDSGFTSPTRAPTGTADTDGANVADTLALKAKFANLQASLNEPVGNGLQAAGLQQPPPQQQPQPPLPDRAQQARPDGQAFPDSSSEPRFDPKTGLPLGSPGAAAAAAAAAAASPPAVSELGLRA